MSIAKTPAAGAQPPVPADVITRMCGATVQHGPLNQRIYLMSMGEADAGVLVGALDRLAREAGYSKVFAKVHEAHLTPFLSKGYIKEAAVPGYFAGDGDAAFLGKYFTKRRREEPGRADILNIVEASSAELNAASFDTTDPRDFRIRRCTDRDVDAMTSLYRAVFRSYPFPIDNPDYLLSTMKTHVRYYCAEARGELIALSSAERDRKNRAVEMTDFATHPKHRGRRAAGHLLRHMERDMRRSGMGVLYTIARARSRPINRLFGSAGYAFGGILVNNTHIGGQIESMTVWHKSLLGHSDQGARRGS